MKKIFSMLTIVVIVSMYSCSSDTSPSGKSTTGSLTVSLKFIDPESSETKAYSPSTSIPTTSWTNSVKDLMLIMTDASNVIQYAIPVPMSSITGISGTTPIPITFSNIPVGTYTSTIIANSQQSNISTLGYNSGWNSAVIVGQNLNTLVLKLVNSTSYTPVTGETGYTGYQSPAEIFSASQSNVVIKADQNTNISALSLARIVSLLRVRIDQSKNGNNTVSFTNTNADLRVRFPTLTYNIYSGQSTSPLSTNVLYVGGPGVYKTTEPASGYGAGSILDIPNGITVWTDVVMFPGGSTTDGTKKFNIVISGMAPVGYIPKGTSTALTVPTLVFWSGQVETNVTSNSILDVNCLLNSAGSTSVAAAGSYGSLSITIGLTQWNTIVDTTIPF